MNMVFAFERRYTIPIIRVTGVAQPMPGIDRGLLGRAVQIIEKAEKYRAKLLDSAEIDNMSDIPNEIVAVRFYLIFESEADLKEAVSGIQKELG